MRVMSVLILTKLLLASTFFAVFTLCDIVGEERHQNFTTQPTEPPDMPFSELEEAGPAGNTTTPLAAVDDFSPPVGYSLYFSVMTNVGGYFTPQAYRGVKLGILTVSLCNLTFALGALIGIFCLPLLHPTSLVFVEGGFIFSTVLLLTMAVLGRTSGFLGQTEIMILASVMVLIFIESSIVQSYYTAEKDRLKDVFDYETVSYKSYEIEEETQKP